MPGLMKNGFLFWIESKSGEVSMLDDVILNKEEFKDPFISRYVSDGTLKMFAYLILLNDPTPHPLLCIEEPENQLHPDLLLE
jgi:predicted ATPase